ncbi:MAG TPA: gamma-glutamyltransferase [Gemmataceae bacterium]|jgi:gamma-glutamyltranspeptidase/glutathione hydrolase
MARQYPRRDVLKLAGGVLLGSVFPDVREVAAADGKSTGCVVGHPEAAKAGVEVLTAGGNAIDAAVTAALVAGVIAPHQCGPGGYGGHMVIAPAGGKKVTAIDFNMAAPRAARADMFAPDSEGKVKGETNSIGWLAAGVSGTLAGLQLALDRHGTRSFRQCVQPALRLARDGFAVDTNLANATRGRRKELAKDPASARLLLRDGEPLKVGDTFRNTDLAAMFQRLADQNSVEDFYRGDIARRIAAAFKKNGGLATAEDFDAYHAREVEPLELAWRDCSIRTAPLTAGGTSAIEALAILKELGWEKWAAGEAKTSRTCLEALRIAWDDRLRLFGDPAKVKVPLDDLLSPEYARRMAGRVRASLEKGRPVPATTDRRPAKGTIHLSAADVKGNLIALTLTHGESFGARVTVPGLGLILGHGISRFDPRPGQPNSIGSGKRPLNNMCPTVVLRKGVPVAALGGAGGRRIPNALFEVLIRYVGRGLSLEDAVAAPRLHTEGDLNVLVEKNWPKEQIEQWKKIGYTVKTGASARISAVSFDPRSKEVRCVTR